MLERNIAAGRSIIDLKMVKNDISSDPLSVAAGNGQPSGECIKQSSKNIIQKSI